MTKITTSARGIAAGLMALGLTLSSAQIAQASAAAEPVPDLGPTSSADSASTTVAVEHPTYDGGISLPGEISEVEVDASRVPRDLDLRTGAALLSTEVEGARVTTYPTDFGTQTFIEIPDAAAPSEYAFELTVPTAARIAVEADGSVTIRDPQGSLLSGYAAPWAFDAAGNPVDTSFSVRGRTLVQAIVTDEDTVFPVIADPSDLWGWATCIGTVLAEVGGNAVVAAKLAKLASRFGTIQRGVEVMVRAWRSSTNHAARLQAVGAAVGGIGAEILGITAIRAACFS